MPHGFSLETESRGTELEKQLAERLERQRQHEEEQRKFRAREVPDWNAKKFDIKPSLKPVT